MLDTGAEINLLKLNRIRRTAQTNTTETVYMTGISADRLTTLGTVNIRIFGELVKFHLVPKLFPIEADGILGTEFLKSKSATIDYFSQSLKFLNKTIPFVSGEVIDVPSRSSRIFFCNVSNLNTDEGYIPRLGLPPGVYAGDALVKNINGKAYFKIHNTTHEKVSLTVPTLELLDFSVRTLPDSDHISLPPDPDDSEYLHSIHTILYSDS